MDTVTSNSVTYKTINRSEGEDARKIDATCKNNGSGPGWRRKMKMAIIDHLIFGKLMLVALHFISIAINL